MKLFITARFKGDENKPDIEKLCGIVRKAGFEDFCFIRDVEKYQRSVFKDSHKLMNRAREALLQCDALLIDVSDNPGGGRAIEAGVAFGNINRSLLSQNAACKLEFPCLALPVRLSSMIKLRIY